MVNPSQTTNGAGYGLGLLFPSDVEARRATENVQEQRGQRLASTPFGAGGTLSGGAIARRASVEDAFREAVQRLEAERRRREIARQAQERAQRQQMEATIAGNVTGALSNYGEGLAAFLMDLERGPVERQMAQGPGVDVSGGYFGAVGQPRFTGLDRSIR